MAHPCEAPLGCTKLDAVQTIKKAWDHCNLGHRVVTVNTEWNTVEHTYGPCGKISTVTYSYEADAESTRITAVADVCGSLCNKSFALYTRDDEHVYTILYSVDCALTKPVNVNGSRYVLVNIRSNDPAEVVSLATVQAINANTYSMAEFTAVNTGTNFVVTNTVKGDARNVTERDSGFTFEVLQQGTKTEVEVLTYTYNMDGKLEKVATSSGKNVMDVNGPFEQMTTIAGNGKIARISDNSELAVELSPLQTGLLYDVVKQLKIMNSHLSIITDETITERDIE